MTCEWCGETLVRWFYVSGGGWFDECFACGWEQGDPSLTEIDKAISELKELINEKAKTSAR